MTSAAGTPAYEISNHARPRPGKPPQSHLLALRRLCRDRPGAHGAGLGMRTVRHRSRRISCPRCGATDTASTRKRRLPAEAADEALVMGLRLAEGIDAEAIARASGTPAIVNWRRVDRLVASGHLARDGGRISLTPRAGCCSTRSSAEISAEADLRFRRLLKRGGSWLRRDSRCVARRLLCRRAGPPSHIYSVRRRLRG